MPTHRAGGNHKSHRGASHKTIKVSHRHNKAYRRTHLVFLTLSLLGILGLVLYIARYNFIAQNERKNARTYITNIIPTNNAQLQTVTSTYGFSFKYDPSKFYGSAIDSTSGGLFIGNELAKTRAYEVVKLSTSLASQPQNNSTVSIIYHNDMVSSATNADYATLEKQLVEARRIANGGSYTRQSSANVMLDGTKFVRTLWTQQLDPSTTNSKLTTSFVSYTGIVNGHPVTIEITIQLGSQTVSSDAAAIINSVTFGRTLQSYIPESPIVAARKAQSQSLLNRLTFTGVAAAVSAEDTNVTAAERVSSLFSPATVKVYNVYCMDVRVLGQAYLNGACNAVAGSAFFVSNDGYLATNGHVATSDPKDIVIRDAIVSAQAGQTQYFAYLTKLAKVNLNDPSYASLTKTQLIGKLIDKFYQIPDSTFTKTNDVSNLLVALNEDEPDIQELIADTKARKPYPEQASIKHAKVVAADYRAYDGIDGFKASDVALMKIDGNDFPLVQLGAIENVSQGSDLNILGFPGNASSNGLVDDTHSKATLTTGKVSSIKNASGSSKKLIETDTTIGHGNSGGPVFDDDGQVIGIATYTVDGSGSGNGIYNYIRDIQDFKDLVDRAHVAFDSDSKVQKEWETGINKFYDSHYSSALGNFEAVKKLYPQHPTVDSFVATAKTRIANGQDIKDFPTLTVLLGAVVLLGGAGASAYLMVRHKKTHNIYRHQVAQNTMPPVTPANSPVVTTYDPSQYGRMGQPPINGVRVAPQPTPQPVSQPAPAPQQLIQPQTLPAAPTVPPVPSTIPGPTVIRPTVQPGQGQTYESPPVGPSQNTPPPFPGQ